MKRRNSQLRLKSFRVEEFTRRLATLDEMGVDLEKNLPIWKIPWRAKSSGHLILRSVASLFPASWNR